jgi:HemY protein
MLEAEAKLEQRQPVEALALLQALRREAGLHTAALRLELRALQSAGRYADIPALVDQLVKRKAYGADEGELVRAAAHAAELRARAGDRNGLRNYWAPLADAEQRSPKIALAAARAFLAQGADHEAADVIVRCLERNWDPTLVAAYAECRLADPTRQLEQAERWLGNHNQDATLLRSLGLLCQRHELWGKAQTYLEASLAVEPSYLTHLTLGELLARLGRASEGSEHLAAALKLAVAELERGG